MADRLPISDAGQGSPGSSIGFFLREALRRIWRSRRTSITAILMITIALTILGLFLLTADNLQRSIAAWERRTTLTIFLIPDVGEEAVGELRGLLNESAIFGEPLFVSREEAAERFRAHFTGLGPVLDELDENPFPASLQVEVSESAIGDPRLEEAVARIRQLPQVDQIQYDWEWADRVQSVVRGMRLIGTIAGGILALAAAFTTASVIRLSVVLYRDEIDIMRLVGATEWMVRGPLFVQGLLQGLVGSALAIGVLGGLFVAARAATADTPTLVSSALLSSFLSIENLALIAAGGTFAGLLGGWMSMSEVNEDVPVRA